MRRAPASKLALTAFVPEPQQKATRPVMPANPVTMWCGRCKRTVECVGGGGEPWRCPEHEA